MPSEAFVDALNQQIANEFAAAHQYVAIGVHYESQTFPRLASFFYGQADEERGHAMTMARHLLDTGAPVQLDAIGAPTREFEDHVAPIALALEQERRVSVQIGELLELARRTQDHAGERLMQAFVEEQVEEEATMQDLLAVAERTRQSPMLL